jgi:uncharacterized protein (TIGR01777 family)
MSSGIHQGPQGGEMKILMTGATGLIGKALAQALSEKGHQLFIVSRNKDKAKTAMPVPVEVIEGDLTSGPILDSRLDAIEVVFNLMGESIDGRWTAKKKESIYNSRVKGTRHLIESLKYNPQVIVSASAMGFYGDRGDEILDETQKHGQDFLAHVCRDWETQAAHLACRKVFIRTGLVLAQTGGALPKMTLPFRFGLGGSLGSGQQWVSWIHLQDIVGLYVHAMETESLHGPLNGTTGQPARNTRFSDLLSASYGHTRGPSVPEFVLKLALGEMSSVLLSSQRASAEKAMTSGYKFKFPSLEAAFTNLQRNRAQMRQAAAQD